MVMPCGQQLSQPVVVLPIELSANQDDVDGYPRTKAPRLIEQSFHGIEEARCSTRCCTDGIQLIDH
jgi:hypothetical protein